MVQVEMMVETHQIQPFIWEELEVEVVRQVVTLLEVLHLMVETEETEENTEAVVAVEVLVQTVEHLVLEETELMVFV